MKRFLRRSLLGALGLAACLSAPDRAAAYPLLDSSMSVECITSGSDVCTSLRFALQVTGDHRLTFLRITHPIPSVFSFGNNVFVADANGEVLGWSSGTWTMNDLSIEFLDGAGAAAYEPLYTTVDMGPGSTGTAADMRGMKFEYYAKGFEGLTGTERFESYGGTTTPEPASMMLLGSGLVGLAGAARRRRKAQSKSEA